MSNDDQRAKDLVIKTLEDPGILKINFWVGAYEITSASFVPVLFGVRFGKIAVKYDEKLGRGASYDSGRNVLRLGFATAPSWNHNALIVHECVHAAMDARPEKFRSIDHATSEAAGYIAQAMFKLAKVTEAEYSDRLRSADESTDKIFRSSWNVALAYLTGERVNAHDLIKLETALNNHRWYAAKSNMVANFNGVHQRAVHASHSHAHAH